MARAPGISARIGIDVGAVSLSLVEVDDRGVILRSQHVPHHGDPGSVLVSALERWGMIQVGSVAATNSTPPFIRADRRHDNQICLIAAARRLHPEARSILVVGGERFGLVRFDARGRYRSFRANPLCAAGTGGFLDQQARRLNLTGSDELAQLALRNHAPPPRIASRCAVFAKTDLVHAQQEGHSLAAICDGLCLGVAKNLVDTLFAGEGARAPLLVVGGVARNRAVMRHLGSLLDVELVVDGDVPYGAAGAALQLLEEEGTRGTGMRPVTELLDETPRERSYEYPPLKLRHSEYPDFTSREGFLFEGRAVAHSHPLEVDHYREVASGRHPVYLGFDIGSTSTKAVVTDETGVVLAGFYTATAGRPLVAARLILEALVDWERRHDLKLDILGAGTTGAGRKFIGRILGADLVLDEITAHARAAVELHPDVDTIIEIGGQDSKFTTLRDGRVTLSVMNSVCAAGTGSFIEEQARRLGVPLGEYDARSRGWASPLASERCTVFMERDLNHHLREGYRAGEVLATVLHSVRENYLNKVAVESAIGDVVVFQGATARNRALVAAFEQRLDRPILVSRFCHLAGALGVTLTLRDEGVRASSFRGVGLHRMDIPVRTEVCELCANHCKLTVAEVEGESVAYGFLCGRDYATRRFVRSNTSGFDLFRERKRALRLPVAKEEHRSLPFLPTYGAEPRASRKDLTVGIPAALHLFEDLPLWRGFFQRLGVKVVTSEGYADAVKDGRTLAAAELCAPMTALHAHVRHLLDKADVVFLPFYLERKPEEKGVRRQLCYYTQFAPSVGAGVGGAEDGGRILSPLVFSLHGPLFTKAELYRALRTVIPGGISPLELSGAFDEAERARDEALRALRQVYRKAAPAEDGFHVVLLGRPYTVLSEWMNKGIPGTFASLGVRAFYQDMVSYGREEVAGIAPLLGDVHWHYAARILEVAEVVARTPGAYPVLMTSFKCSPDSFVSPYVRRILEEHGKPYLILELDEHDSRLGYETRIEAAVRAFRNHFAARSTGSALRPRLALPVVEPTSSSVRPPGGEPAAPPPPERSLARWLPREIQLPWSWPRISPPSLSALASPGKAQLKDKTILFPNWDPLSLRLVVAAVRKTGLDARLLEASEGSMRRSLRHNSGQCTPLNIIAQEFMEYVQAHGLDPSRTALWMVASSIACNIHLYPRHIRTILEDRGRGFDASEVYSGGITLQDIAPTLPLDAYLAYMFGGFLRRMGCRIRPYERVRGETDRVLQGGLELLERSFATDASKEEALAEVVSRLKAIEVMDGEARPEVAVFGDLYARDNRVLNQDLVHFVEAHGGEVITTPYTSYAKMVARPYYWKWFLEGKVLNALSTKAWMTALAQVEKKYFRHFERVLGEPEPSYDASPQAILSAYRIRVEHTGEAMDNLLKVFYLTRHHPEVALFVQASPAFCCPSLVTEAMAREIEEKTGVPVVSVTYDGTGGGKNEVILPYLAYPRARGGRARRVS